MGLRGVTRGEVGCTLSHTAALRLIANSQPIPDTIQHYMIIEDDATWESAHFAFDLQNMLNDELFPYDRTWPLFWLGVAKMGQAQKSVSENIELVGYKYQTHAYMVGGPKAAQKVLDASYVTEIE